MVACEYCLKDMPKGEKRTRCFFIVIEHDEPIHKDGLEAHVDENHHQIMVCKKCEKKIFSEKKEKK